MFGGVSLALEWHDRKRCRRGRFARHLDQAYQQQFHIRMNTDAAEIVRKKAREAHEEIGEYIKKAVALRIMGRTGPEPREKAETADG